MTGIRAATEIPHSAARLVNDSLLTKDQVAHRLGVSLRTIEAWMHQRVIPHVKIKKVIRFCWPDVEEALKRGFGVGYGRIPVGRHLAAFDSKSRCYAATGTGST